MRTRTMTWATALILSTTVFLFPVQSQLLSGLISPLLQVWVRSQVQQVDDLRVVVNGPDAELSNGRIQSIDISGRNLVYSGIPARSLSLRGSDIRLDTRRALQGGGLRLEQPVRADIALSLSEQDINTYLASPTFQEQVKDLKVKLPTQFGGDQQTEVKLELLNPSARLLRDRLEIAATVRLQGGEPAPLRLSTGIAVNGRQLRLVDPQLVDEKGQGVAIESLAGLQISIGRELELRRVAISPGLLVLEGTYQVQATPVASRP